jgi:hypothetical protein
VRGGALIEAGHARWVGWLAQLLVFLQQNGHLVVGHSPVLHYLHPPQSVLGVPPPSEDDGPIKDDFASITMKENFASGIHKGSNGEEIIDKAIEAVSQARFWG